VAGSQRARGVRAANAWLARLQVSPGARHAPSLAPRPARSFVSPPVPKFPPWWDAAQKLHQGEPRLCRPGRTWRACPRQVAALIKAGGLSSKVAAATPPLRGAAA